MGQAQASSTVYGASFDSSISLKKAQETMGREIYWQLPNDYKTMVEVRNNGVPLIEQAPKASITQAVSALADNLTGDHEKPDAATATAGTKTTSWLGFLGAKSKAGKNGSCSSTSSKGGSSESDD